MFWARHYWAMRFSILKHVHWAMSWVILSYIYLSYELRYFWVCIWSYELCCFFLTHKWIELWKWKYEYKYIEFACMKESNMSWSHVALHGIWVDHRETLMGYWERVLVQSWEYWEVPQWWTLIQLVEKRP